MPRHPIVIALLLAGTAPILAGSASAQGPSAAEAAARLRPGRVPTAGPAPTFRSFVPADSIASGKKDHTLTGLLIGSAVGFTAGWAFYDVICEAVDNRCSDSRFRLVLLGTGVGGALGALVGSLAD